MSHRRTQQRYKASTVDFRLARNVAMAHSTMPAPKHKASSECESWMATLLYLGQQRTTVGNGVRDRVWIGGDSHDGGIAMHEQAASCPVRTRMFLTLHNQPHPRWRPFSHGAFDGSGHANSSKAMFAVRMQGRRSVSAIIGGHFTACKMVLYSQSSGPLSMSLDRVYADWSMFLQMHYVCIQSQINTSTVCTI